MIRFDDAERIGQCPHCDCYPCDCASLAPRGFCHPLSAAQVAELEAEEREVARRRLPVEVRAQRHNTAAEWEWLGRRHKAEKLVAVVRDLYHCASTIFRRAWSSRMLALQVERFDSERWAALAHVAGVKPPSAKTVALVIEMLRMT